MLDDVCLVRDPLFLDHLLEPGHPESPARLQAVYHKLDADPLLRDLPTIKPRPASRVELERVHELPMIEKVLAARGEEGWFDADTFYGAKSVDAALGAAGATVELALRIWRGEYRRGFSLTRPPGHHATGQTPMGFCLLNNAALAVAAIRAESPRARLAIVDFDLHHGNGTQDLFYEDPDVLFLSSHRYPFYPGTGATDEVGHGRGQGTTVNFPLATAYGDELFLPLYRKIVLPMLESFRPDMLIVSAGFDGHAEDPMRGFRVSTEFYRRLAEWLVAAAELTGGRILFCLEGGYHPDRLADAVAETLHVLRAFPRERALAKDAGGEGDFEELELFHRHFRSYFPNLG